MHSYFLLLEQIVEIESENILKDENWIQSKAIQLDFNLVVNAQIDKSIKLFVDIQLNFMMEFIEFS